MDVLDSVTLVCHVCASVGRSESRRALWDFPSKEGSFDRLRTWVLGRFRKKFAVDLTVVCESDAAQERARFWVHSVGCGSSSEGTLTRRTSDKYLNPSGAPPANGAA